MSGQVTSGFPNIYEIWVYLSGSPLLALILTLGAYQIGVIAYERANRHPLANPVLISIVLLRTTERIGPRLLLAAALVVGGGALISSFR